MKIARATLSAIVRGLPVLMLDLAGVAGFGLISYGAWLIYPPAGFITAGVLLTGSACLLGSRGK